MKTKPTEVIAQLNQTIKDLQARLKFYTDREQHFISALKVADNGQYRADWDARIEELVESNQRLTEENGKLLAENDKQGDALIDQCKISMVALDALEKLGLRDTSDPEFEAQVIHAAYRLGRLQWVRPRGADRE